MNPQRIRAVAKKEFLHVVRDPRSLIMGLALPMLLLFMFGYALTLDVDNVPLALWDQDNSPASRELVSRFSGSRYFSLVSQTGGYADLERDIDTRKVLIALVIPTGFADRLAAGETVPVQAIIDGSDSNTATIALGYAGRIVGGFSRTLTAKQLLGQGSDPPRPPIDLVPRVWYNPDLESRIAIIPGLIAVIMMVIAALLTSLTVAREWETGTMEQLIATPLTGFELIIGKLVPYFCIGLFDMALAMLVGRFVFHVPMRGDHPLLLALAILFLLVALSLGMLISIVGKSQFVASQFALMATLLPAFLLSGFVFRIANMPPLLQAFTHVIPARYFVTILRGIYLKGVDLKVLAGEVAFLALFGLLVFLAAVRKFRKRIG